ncbi:MAG: plastocyanin/azurin family copper-binding protein [Chloroflexota bacterium]|nr:plastocyanin/azurin family copper-binding protein [Chloroflexota bacterium]
MQIISSRRIASHRLFSLTAIMGLALLVAACTNTQSGASQSQNQGGGESTAASAGGSAAAGGNTVVLEGFAFEPAELTVHVGDTVTFENKDDTRHTATHGENGTAAENAEFDIDLPESGSTGEYTFDEAGDFPVTCKVHPNMNMTITVEE